jgi:nitroreductase
MPEKFTERSHGAMKIMEPSITKLGTPFNQFIENGSCSFYGAPIAIIVTIDKLFPKIRYLDIGLSVSYLFLAAHAKGLSTCPIGLITAYADDIAEILDIPPEKEILLAISLGYADENSPINLIRTERDEISEIMRWYE